MLLNGIVLISVVAAGVFHLQRAPEPWVTLLFFVGVNLALMALAFGFLMAVCAAVDLSKPQERDSRFYRRVMYLYIEALISLMGVRLHTEGLEKTPKEGRFLLVCNHLGDPDPGILHHCFRKSQLSFVTKWENMSMFVVGKLMHKTLCQPINRENDREALKTILKCIQLLREDQVSIAIFPEGYVSTDGKLHRFRAGAFKIAQKAGVPIVVCTLRNSNTENLIHNAKRLRRTDITLHLVDVIPAEELKGKPTTEISNRVYETMIADLGEDFRQSDAEEN